MIELKPCYKCGGKTERCGETLYEDFRSLRSKETSAKVIANYNAICDKNFPCPICQDTDIEAGDELRLYTHTDCDGGYIVETVYANYCPNCGRDLRSTEVCRHNGDNKCLD